MRIFKPSTYVPTVLIGIMLCAGLVLPSTTSGAAGAAAQKKYRDSFYIISSVDAKKQQIVLKLPSEVTEVVEVTPATTFRDEKGKGLKFEDLRAGDTVYATVIQNSEGSLSAISIRRGPMTLEELHRRYLLEE